MIDLVLSKSYEDRIKLIAVLWAATIRCDNCPFQVDCMCERDSMTCVEYVQEVIGNEK